MRKSIILALFLAAACGDPDPAPTATVVSATPESLDPSDDADDDLTITIEYSDADADLGGGVATVHDCRAEGIVTALELPGIASDDAIAEGVPITGTLALTVADVGDVALDSVAPAACADLAIAAPTPGEAIFCVVLTDAAGNSGSGDCTAPIAILAP